MNRLNTFIPPQPNRLMIGLTKRINRVFMLKGLPLLRDIPGLNKFPPFRGLTNVRRIDLPAADEARLRPVCGPGKATFITPNHPEFFTDWMIDKELLARVAPLAASWATNSVVNGMGKLAQKFWLANNLVAQIPGNSDPAKAFSIDWAVKGNGVLLHPEGMVGWHRNHINTIMPGATEMALEALARGRAKQPDFETWIAPVVTRFVFFRDVEPELSKECAYVERKLKIERAPTASLPERVFDIYRAVLRRDVKRVGIDAPSGASFRQWHFDMMQELCAALGADADQPLDVERALRLARRELRELTKSSADKAGIAHKKGLIDALARFQRLASGWAFTEEMIGQEEIAEHLKRLRNDYCKGTLRDTLGALLPQPAGPRIAHIRVAEPIAVHEFAGDSAALSAELKHRLQFTLDNLRTETDLEADKTTYPNPFYDQQRPKLLSKAAGLTPVEAA